MLYQIHIRRIDIEEVQIAQKFLFKMVKKMFNTDENSPYNKDITNLKEVYIDNKKNAIVGAFNESGELIGTIAINQFVDRFEVLKGIYREEVTAELGRCYIEEGLRRKGIGSLLFEEIIQVCKDCGYEKIYLHTHRHLPGGFDFWEKKGFTITVEDDDKDKTVHMERVL